MRRESSKKAIKKNPQKLGNFQGYKQHRLTLINPFKLL